MRRQGSSEDDRDATDAAGSKPGTGSCLLVEGSEAVDFAGGDREGVHTLVRRTLVKLDYHRLGKPDKGLVKRYLAKVTGLSRAQLTWLIGQHRRTGRIEDRRGGVPVRPFERRYTTSDIRLWRSWMRSWARCRVRHPRGAAPGLDGVRRSAIRALYQQVGTAVALWCWSAEVREKQPFGRIHRGPTEPRLFGTIARRATRALAIQMTRTLLNWRAVLLYTPRWMGVLFGLLFLSWFMPGIAFMYWGMPNVSIAEPMDRQLPLLAITRSDAP